VSAQQLFAGLESFASTAPDKLMPLALLAGFVVEAALKSFLANRLHHSDILTRAPYGHDLEALWREAFAHGLDVASSPPEWCMDLNLVTGKPNFFVRYHTRIHGMTYPVQAHMMSGIRELLATTEASFRSAS
jgi:hypothetical protein